MKRGWWARYDRSESDTRNSVEKDQSCALREIGRMLPCPVDDAALLFYYCLLAPRELLVWSFSCRDVWEKKVRMGKSESRVVGHVCHVCMSANVWCVCVLRRAAAEQSDRDKREWVDAIECQTDSARNFSCCCFVHGPRTSPLSLLFTFPVDTRQPTACRFVNNKTSRIQPRSSPTLILHSLRIRWILLSPSPLWLRDQCL